MPPRLAHKKSRAGCMRCKARKVKCDEILPKCSACVRHNVPCVYPGSTTPTSPSSGVTTETRASEHALELRLMHEWMSHVYESFSIAWEFWKFQAPLIAFEHRYVLDALFALSALHLARQTPKVWNLAEGRLVSAHDDPVGTPSTTSSRPPEKEWKALTRGGAWTPTGSSPGALSPSVQHHVDMLHVSQFYFDRALDGQRKAVAEVTADTIPAVYMCSILVTNYGLLNLGESTHGQDVPSLDPIKWFRIAEGSRHIAYRWMELVGEGWTRLTGNFYGQPDLSDGDELFHPRHREPFAYLLSNVAGDEIVEQDREAYEHTLSYIGLFFKGIVQKLDLPRASCRRVIAMPSRVPPRFAQLIEERQPRAMAILAHMIGAIKLLDTELPWLKGIAERQVPILARSMPEPWQPLMKWPLRIAEGVTPDLLSVG